MNDTNVGPTDPHVPNLPSASGAPTVGSRASLGSGDAASQKREKRRRLLIGGAVAGGLFTLPSSPLLAQTKKKCTVSLISSANPSVIAADTCGNSPGCWRNSNGFPVWADGAKFLGNPVPYTHTTPLDSSTLFSDPLTKTSGNVKFTINGSNLLQDEINQMSGITISVHMANNTKIQFLNQGQLANLVAGLLNSFFFGSHYLQPGAFGLISSFFQSVFTDAKANNSGDISTQVNNLFGTNGTITFANNNFSELCPP